MTIELKYKRGDIVYILIGFEIKKAIINAVFFSDTECLEKHIQYDVVYNDTENNKSKTIGVWEERVFKTPGELLEALNRTIPLS